MTNPKGKHKSDLNRNNVQYFNHIQNPILNSSDAYGRTDPSKAISNLDTKTNPKIAPYNFKIQTISNIRKHANASRTSSRQKENDANTNCYEYMYEKPKNINLNEQSELEEDARIAQNKLTFQSNKTSRCMNRKQNKDAHSFNKPLLNSKKNISQFLISRCTVKYNSEIETLDEGNDSLQLIKNSSLIAPNIEGQPYLERRGNFSKQSLFEIPAYSKSSEKEQLLNISNNGSNIHQMMIKLNSEENVKTLKIDDKSKQIGNNSKSLNRNLKPNFKTKEPEKFYSPKRFQPSFHRRKLYIESQMILNANINKRSAGSNQTVNKYKIYYPGKNISKEDAVIEDKNLIERIGLKQNVRNSGYSKVEPSNPYQNNSINSSIVQSSGIYVFPVNCTNSVNVDSFGSEINLFVEKYMK